MRKATRFTCALAALLVLAIPRGATAQAAGQDSSRASPPDVCFRFMFGAWSPPLDWRAAGHRPPRDSAAPSRTGRGSAAEVSVHGDSALMLLPTWWPAGVLVELSTRTPAFGDTLTGRATAFVADGAIAPPVSQVRAWRVDCRM